MCLSNIEHDVTTSKVFLSPLPRECMSRYFLKTFFLNIQIKVHFKNLLRAVTYDMGVLSCAFDVV